MERLSHAQANTHPPFDQIPLMTFSSKCRWSAGRVTRETTAKEQMRPCDPLQMCTQITVMCVRAKRVVQPQSLAEAAARKRGFKYAPHGSKGSNIFTNHLASLAFNGPGGAAIRANRLRDECVNDYSPGVGLPPPQVDHTWPFSSPFTASLPPSCSTLTQPFSPLFTPLNHV